MRTNTLYLDVHSITNFQAIVKGIYSTLTGTTDHGTMTVAFLANNTTATTRTFNLTGSAADYTSTYTGATPITRIKLFIDVSIAGGQAARINFSDSTGIQLKTLFNDVRLWLGFIQPDQFSRSFLVPAYFVSITANDQLAALKDISFTGMTVGKTTFLQAFTSALSNTGIALDIKSQMNIRESHISTSNVINTVRCYFRDRFSKEKDGQTEFISVYDALSKLTDIFNARVFQAGGYYHIVQKNEIASKQTLFRWNALTGSTTNYNRAIDITNKYALTGSDELTKIKPLKTYPFIQRNSYYGSNELAGATYSNTGSFSSFIDVGGGRVQVEETTTPNSPHYFESSSFTLTAIADANKLKLTFGVGSYYSTSDINNFPPLVEVKLFKDGVLKSTVTDSLPQSGGFKSYSFDYVFDDSGTYNFRISVVPDQRSTTTYVLADFAGFEAIASYETDPFTDTLYTASIVDTSNIAVAEKAELLFGDGYSSDQAATLYYNDTTTGRTSSWSNTGSTSGSDYHVSIQNLYAFNKLALRSKFKDYKKVTIKTKDIDFNNAIYLSGKYYNIISYSYDFKLCNLSLELSEIPTIKPSIWVTLSSLDTSDGNK